MNLNALKKIHNDAANESFEKIHVLRMKRNHIQMKVDREKVTTVKIAFATVLVILATMAAYILDTGTIVESLGLLLSFCLVLVIIHHDKKNIKLVNEIYSINSSIIDLEDEHHHHAEILSELEMVTE